MFYTGLFRRIIPFLLTFVAGLFIASLFVPMALPKFGEWRESRRSRCGHEKRQLRTENNELRERLRTMENENRRRGVEEWDIDDAVLDAVPPVDLHEHKPPPPPKRPRHPKHEILQ